MQPPPLPGRRAHDRAFTRLRSFRIPADLDAQIETYGRATGKSKTAVIVEATRLYLASRYDKAVGTPQSGDRGDDQ